MIVGLIVASVAVVQAMEVTKKGEKDATVRLEANRTKRENAAAAAEERLRAAAKAMEVTKKGEKDENENHSAAGLSEIEQMLKTELRAFSERELQENARLHRLQTDESRWAAARRALSCDDWFAGKKQQDYAQIDGLNSAIKLLEVLSKAHGESWTKQDHAALHHIMGHVRASIEGIRGKYAVQSVEATGPRKCPERDAARMRAELARNNQININADA